VRIIGGTNGEKQSNRKIQSMNTILYLLRGIALDLIIRDNNHALTLFNLITGARKMNTLFNQLSELEQETVAILCGFQMCVGFQNTLYDMPAMEGNMGQIAKAVLKHRLAHLNKITKKTK
jgi:hypothetical protein